MRHLRDLDRPLLQWIHSQLVSLFQLFTDRSILQVPVQLSQILRYKNRKSIGTSIVNPFSVNSSFFILHLEQSFVLCHKNSIYLSFPNRKYWNSVRLIFISWMDETFGNKLWTYSSQNVATSKRIPCTLLIEGQDHAFLITRIIKQSSVASYSLK